MRAEMVDKAIEMVSMLFDFQSCKASVVKGEIRVISSTVISLILSVITSMDINQDEVFEPGRNPYDYIFKAGNLPDMKTYLQDKVIKVINLIRKVKADETSKAMEMILKYVSDNIHKSDLSLKGLANEFYMNYSYLSRKFKQKTGSTFSEYVMKLRMSMAEKIIRETDKKAYQVAEMIGIPDPHYFNICFKKYTNLSISDFRRIHCR
jgi:two-component system response regulator YesN